MNYLLNGGYNPKKLELLLEVVNIRSEDIIAAVNDYLIRGASIDVAASMNLIDAGNLNRAIKKLNAAAERFDKWNQICFKSDASKEVALVIEAKPKPKKFDPLEVVPEAINVKAWREWAEFRKEKRKPISKAAAPKQLKLLAKYPYEVQQDIVNSSIQNDYQGLFEPKGMANAQQNRYAKNSHAQRSADDTRSLLAFADALETGGCSMGENGAALPQPMDSSRGSISQGGWQPVDEFELVAQKDGTFIEG